MSDYEILVIMLTILEIVVMLLIALINAKKIAAPVAKASGFF